MDKLKAMRLLSTRLKAAQASRYFSELARSWDLWHELYGGREPTRLSPARYEAWNQKEARRLIAWLTPRSRLLDLGCGSGRIFRLTAPHCGRAHGADISPKALVLAARRCRGLDNVRFHRVKSWKLEFKSSTFDLISCRSMLQYLDIESVVAYFKEIRRVLKPGGRLICDLPNFSCAANIAHLLHPEKTNWPGINRFRFWTPEMAKTILARCGLRVEKLSAGRFIEVRARKPGK